MITKLKLVHLGVSCLLLSFLTGCATRQVPQKSTEYAFFPPSPDEPRIQFLKAFASDVELGRSGTFAEFITGQRKQVNPLVKPYGVAMHGGKIYVCDTVANVIEVFDMQSRRAAYFAPKGEGQMRLPVNITIDEDGTRYVADTGRNQILIFGENDAFLAAIGLRGEMRPTDVAVTTDRLFITDLEGHAVRVYGKADRKLLFTIPLDPKAGEGKLFSPTNLAVDRQGGRLLVADTGAFVVQVYDLDGRFIRTIGKQGVAPGLFARPKGVAVDREGRTYVVDAATQVVQMFDTEGNLLMFFGQAGASMRGELILPAAIDIDYDNVGCFQEYVAPGYQCEYLILVTSQFGGQKVSVYGFLKKS